MESSSTGEERLGGIKYNQASRLILKPYIDRIKNGTYKKNKNIRNTNLNKLGRVRERFEGNPTRIEAVNTIVSIIENEKPSEEDSIEQRNSEPVVKKEVSLIESNRGLSGLEERLQAQGQGASNDPFYNGTPSSHIDIHTPGENTTPCATLYDPCSGKPLEVNTIQSLERRVREIRSSLSDNPEVEKFPESIATRLDLLINLLNRKEPPNSNLFKYTINGQLYEAYWDIVFALNLLEGYERTDKFFMINKKAEQIHASESEIYIKDPIEYLQKRNVNEGASGASDITFCYKDSKESIVQDSCAGPVGTGESCSITEHVEEPRTKFYFCSSKFYKKDSSKSAESFDIQKIYTAVKKLHQDYDVRIILLVKDKNAVDEKLKNARNKYISEEASKVYGERDLFSALLKLYELAKQKIQGDVTVDSLKNVLGLTDRIKPILSPRLHQHMAILKIQKAINVFKASGGNNKFLIGILPRGGKTYIAGGIVSVLQPRRVVVLLGAKSETISQFTNDLFNYYQDFSDYKVVNVLDESKEDPMIDSSKKYIFVMSVELYKMESSRSILKELKGGKNKADLFICDEAHLKQTTANAVKALEAGTAEKATDKDEETGLQQLDNAISKEVPVVFMSGTYIKPLSAFDIPEENVAIWDYQDVQEGKHLIDNEEYFKNTFPGIYEEALAKCFSYGETYESIQAMYKKFPNLYLLSTQFTDEVKNAFLKQSESGEKVGFPTLTHLFQVKKDYSPDAIAPSRWHTGFTNPKGMARLINYLSTPEHQIKNIQSEPTPSVMKRIDRISQRIGDRLAFFTKDFVVHSQLWFLPSMNGHPLIKRMSALGGMIFQSGWYSKHFNILAVSSSADWNKIKGAKDNSIRIGEGTFSWACPNSSQTLKACILKEEAKSRAQGKGLIILAQNMLQLGISLTCVDIVVLLDAGEKVDERIQKMYRALTESTNKKGGFIVDLNYFRTVQAIMKYTIQATKMRKNKEIFADNLTEVFNSVLETFSIDDDLDIYGTTEEGGSRIASETIPELQRMIPSKGRSEGLDISDAGGALNRNIETVLKDEYDRGLNSILGAFSENESKKLLRAHGENVGAAEEEKEKEEKQESERGSLASRLFPNAVAKNPAEKRKAFMDMFKTTLKIGVFATNYRTIDDVINGLRTNEEFREVVYDTLVKRGAISSRADQPELIDIIIKELELLSEKKGDSYSGMKDSFNSKDKRSTKFHEVLNYIKDNLTPKDIERHKYGEVFTPLTLVDEMLSKLPSDVWSKKDYTWLDPANGIGNFPIKAFIGQSEGEHTYPGLFEGLRKEIPDDSKRCKWIVEHMLYMIDINGKNNMIARRLFEKLCPGAKANIEKIDSEKGFFSTKPLVFNTKTLTKFDIIMGNPPFNPPKTETGSSGNSIWQNFVIKSHSMLNNNGYLVFVHPPGWKKPADEIFKPEKFAGGDYTGQIRQGQVWQVLKDSGVFKFIYTNDQKSKAVGEEYLPHFPAVDYYVYEKGGDKSTCDTKNVFLGTVENSKGVRLNYNLKYLPNLITKETQDILHKVTSKEGNKPEFSADRKLAFGKTLFAEQSKGAYKYIYSASKKGPIYAYSSTKIENLDENKVIMNFDGGIDAYFVEFIDSNKQIGSAHKSMYSKVDSHKDGKRLELFLKSDIVKFIFLITQYASGQRTQNEPLVANSITIPPEGIADYYKFFGIEEHKKYIEELLAHYEKFKAPKRLAKTVSKGKGGRPQEPLTKTRKIRR